MTIRDPHRVPPLPVLWLATALLFAPRPAAASADTVHPACLEPYLDAPSRTAAAPLDPATCSARHADVPVRRIDGRLRYDRPRGPAGVDRGSLEYERVRGSGGRLVYRVIERGGGSGVFSTIVTGRVADGDGRLHGMRTHPLGDRCGLGSAWIGRGERGDPHAAVALTPAALLPVLAAPPGRLPRPARDRRRATHAFGREADAALADCPTCCVGEAVYRLTRNGRWDLEGVELDRLEPFAGGAWHQALRAVAATEADGHRIPPEGAARLRAVLADAHPSPGDLRRTQFWLQRLGYYWLAPVDGIDGPRTDAARSAFRHAHAAAIARQGFEGALVRAGLGQDAGRLQPVDETGRNPDFRRFRERLTDLVARRDGTGLAALAAPGIVLGYGDGGGPAELRRLLAHADSRRALWRDLEDALTLGAVRTGPGAFCLPYPACVPEPAWRRVPLRGRDPVHTVIVTTPNAPLRAGPDPDAPTLRRLDHEALLVLAAAGDTADGTAAWRVRDRQGRGGWLARADGGLPTGPRVEAVRGEAGWRLTAVVGGP